jgi:tetratricopeptide (TPR) repeat protein
MKRTTIILIMALLPLMLSAGKTQQALIAMADSAYNQKLYTEAIAKYEAVIAQNYESAELYYNLGNAYFNINDLPSAILNYERARVLDPRDEDIAFNLKIANSMITDKIEAVPEIFYVEWWKSLRDSFNLHTWTLASISLFIILLICTGFFILSRRIALRKAAFWAGIVFLLMSIASFSISYTKYDTLSNHLEAIVFDPTVTVKSSPSDSGKDLFVIHDGTKVFIMEEINGWCNIRIANGSEGWMPLQSLRRI